MELFRSGELRGFKIGKSWRTRREAIDDYISKSVEDQPPSIPESAKNKIKAMALLRSHSPKLFHKKTIDKLQGVTGLYALFDVSKELIYLGKSIDLAKRIFESLKKHETGFFFRYAITNNEADANILEPYLISKADPPNNSEFKTKDKPTFTIPVPEWSEFIKVYPDEDFELDDYYKAYEEYL